MRRPRPARRAAHLRDGRPRRRPHRGADRRRARRSSRASSARRSRPARSASRRRAPTSTARRTATNIGTLTASERELLAIADGAARRRARRDAAHLRLLPDPRRRVRERASSTLIEAFARTSGRPLSFTVQQAYHSPERWRQIFDARRRAARRRPRREAAGRAAADRRAARARRDREPVPLHRVASDEVADLPLAERVAALRDPERRAPDPRGARGAWSPASPTGCSRQISRRLRRDVPALRSRSTTSSTRDWSLGARARAAGADPAPTRVRRAARARRAPAALPAAVQLRPRQLRRHPRDDLHAVRAVRPVRRRRALRRDLRREHDHVVARRVGPRPQAAATRAAGRADRAPADPAHRRARRLARPRRRRARLRRRPQRRSTSTRSAAGRRTSCTTCRPAAAGSCRRPTATACTVKSGTVTFEDGEQTGELPGAPASAAPGPHLPDDARPTGADCPHG